MSIKYDKEAIEAARAAYDALTDAQEDGYMGVKSFGICFCEKSCIVGKYER